MSALWIKTNWLIKTIFSNYVWRIPTREKIVYLTFDDGPTPEITDWVLNQLQQHQAKATFFCIGNNIEKYPSIFNRILANGHAIGNHTFNHLQGWKTQTSDYIENVEKCALEITQHENTNSKLFRPPYGKIKPAQAKMIRELGYKIIMWDVLSADFNQAITPQQCLDNVVSNIASGSIIVFHDSLKAFPNLEYTLPKTLKFLSENGYTCEVLV